MFTLQDLGIKERIAIKERGKAFTMRYHHDSLREMDSYPIISIRRRNGELPITCFCSIPLSTLCGRPKTITAYRIPKYIFINVSAYLG